MEIINAELEEHWSLIQSYIQSLDDTYGSIAEKDTLYTDTRSISSYSNGPEYFTDSRISDDERTVQQAQTKAGKPYTRSENDLIWNTYRDNSTPESRREALVRIAVQLGRTFKGIVTHVRDMQKQKSGKSHRKRRSSSGASSSTSSSESSGQSSSDSSECKPVQNSTPVTAARMRHGKGYLYTDDEDTDIWTAYLSTSNRAKRTEALRAVAVRYDRSYTALMSRLKKLLAAQNDRFEPVPSSARVSEESEDNDSGQTMVVHKVSDVSDSQSDTEQPDIAHNSAPQTHPTSAMLDHSLLQSHQPPTYSPSYDQENRLRVRAAMPDGTPITFCGDTAKSLAYYRSTTSAAIYAPETVDERLGRYVKSLRVNGMDMVFPKEAHDQVTTYQIYVGTTIENV